MVKCGTFMKRKLNLSKSPDYLTPLLEKAPAGWALIRANEIRALEEVEFEEPVLDIGCGDGLVAKVILSKRKTKFDFGLDISEREIKKAKKSGIYKKCIVGDVYNLPFEDNKFQTVFSNSTVEHFKDLDLALSEIQRVLRPGGQLIITVPSAFLSSYLLGSRFFAFFGLRSVAKLYAKFFHSLVRHYNLHNHKQWERILKKHKLILTSYFYYHSPGMIQVHEIFSYIAIPQHIIKFLLGTWPVFVSFRKIFVIPFARIFYRNYLNDISKKQGGSLLLVSKKNEFD